MSLQATPKNEPVVALQPTLRRVAKAPLALTLGLVMFFLANALLLNGVIWSASPEAYRATVLKHSWDVLRGEGGDDSPGEPCKWLSIMSTNCQKCRSIRRCSLPTISVSNTRRQPCLD